MKTADKENPTAGTYWSAPSTWCGWSEQILLNQVGCEAGNGQPLERCFLLTSTFIELTRTYRVRSMIHNLPIRI